LRAPTRHPSRPALKLEQHQPGVALALNQHILPRERWEHHLLQEGDQILLFQVIAGG
jgi:sulfur carrier protein